MKKHISTAILFVASVLMVGGSNISFLRSQNNCPAPTVYQSLTQVTNDCIGPRMISDPSSADAQQSDLYASGVIA